MKLRDRKLLYGGIAAFALILLIALLSLSKRSEFISEYIFARGISRFIIYFTGTVTSVFPFSIFEILCAAGIILLVVSIIRWIKWIKRKRYNEFLRSVTKILVAALSVILVYTVSASFAYYREPLEKHVPQSESRPEKEELIEIVNYFIDDFNYLSETLEYDDKGFVVSPYSFGELTKVMQNEFSKLSRDKYFNPYNARAKRLISSDIFAFFDISGISFQPTGEANVNRYTSPADMPYLMSHEISHTKGAMYESDAELLASYITLTSDDNYIRYSGYSSCIGRIMNTLLMNGMDDEYTEAYYRIAPKIRAEWNAEREYYSTHYGKFGEIGRYINDLYLKFSGASDGVGSYTDDPIVIETPIIQEDGSVIIEIEVVKYTNIQKLMMAVYFG